MTGDLHMHSYYSDGAYSPSEVMRKAKEAGCEVAALTDHDNIAGIAEADAAAESLGIKNIAGVELSTFDGDTEAHILGYRFDPADTRLCALIQKQKAGRRERSDRIISALAARGMTFPPEVFDNGVPHEISRSHIASALVECGYEPDFSTAMNKWLRDGAPTFARMSAATPREAIETIHAAGGVAVLAHPVRLNLDGYERTDFIKKLAGCGLDGIEALYKRSSHETVRELRLLADSLGLLVTGGADYHADRNEIIPRPQPDVLTR